MHGIYRTGEGGRVELVAAFPTPQAAVRAVRRLAKRHWLLSTTLTPATVGGGTFYDYPTAGDLRRYLRDSDR